MRLFFFFLMARVHEFLVAQVRELLAKTFGCLLWLLKDAELGFDKFEHFFEEIFTIFTRNIWVYF